MNIRKKKIAAAMAAVEMYLEQEQAAQSAETSRPEPVFSTWAGSGRESIMRMRNMLQARLWK